MPTYQYSCTECGHFLEQFQAFTDDALTECPVCGGRLRKVFNAVGVVFKGSGFYRNDSRTGQGSDAGSGSGSEKSGSEKSSAEKSSGSKESTTGATSGSSSGGSSSGGSGTKGPDKSASKAS